MFSLFYFFFFYKVYSVQNIPNHRTPFHVRAMAESNHHPSSLSAVRGTSALALFSPL